MLMEAKPSLHPALTVRLYTDKKCFGPGVAMLLERVRKLRSLRAAARDMDMAYSKAWTILHTAEEELGFKLVRAAAGGRGGGGGSLTPEGEALLEAFGAYERELKETADRLFSQYFQAFLPAGPEDG